MAKMGHPPIIGQVMASQKSRPSPMFRWMDHYLHQQERIERHRRRARRGFPSVGEPVGRVVILAREVEREIMRRFALSGCDGPGFGPLLADKDDLG